MHLISLYNVALNGARLVAPEIYNTVPKSLTESLLLTALADYLFYTHVIVKLLKKVSL